MPGTEQMLVARETRQDGRYRQSFEIVNMNTLETVKQADKPNNLSTFYRWQDPVWKGQTVSVRN